MEKSKISATSRGWLAFFTMVYSVLLVVFAVSLSMWLTIGIPSHIETALQTPAILNRVTARVNRIGVKSAADSGITLPNDAELVQPQTVSPLVKKGVQASVDFKDHLDLTPLHSAMMAGIKKAAAKASIAYSKTAQQQVKANLNYELNRQINKELMQQSWGEVYGMLVLIMQTATIVAGILGFLTLLLMRAASHSWRRFLLAFGRSSYVIGIFGGIGALIAGMPQVAGHFSRIHLPAGFLKIILMNAAPLWQRTALVVVLCGLALAGLGRLFHANGAHAG